MRIFLSIVLTPLLFSLLVIAQATEKNIDNLNRANSQLNAKFQSGEIDDAIKAAKIVLDLTILTYGAEHAETARSYKNIGELYRIKSKYREAADYLQKAYVIYQIDITHNEEAIGKVLDSLGKAMVRDGKRDKAEAIFAQAVSNAEKVFGLETKQTLPSLKSLTNFYVFSEQYDRAEDILLKRHIIYGIFQKKNDTAGLDYISDDRFCYMSQHFKGDEYTKRDKAFSEKLKAERAKRFGEEPPPPKSTSTVAGGVINGKATSLAKPVYPGAARRFRLSGSVSIKVLIDEKGNVISAKGFCGDPIFYAASESAARQSKFSPTALSGEPVKVSGVITYNFSAR